MLVQGWQSQGSVNTSCQQLVVKHHPCVIVYILSKCFMSLHVARSPRISPFMLAYSTGNNRLLEAAKAREWGYSPTLYIQVLTENPMNSSAPLKVAFTIQDHDTPIGNRPMLWAQKSYALHVWKKMWADQSCAFSICKQKSKEFMAFSSQYQLQQQKSFKHQSRILMVSSFSWNCCWMPLVVTDWDNWRASFLVLC